MFGLELILWFALLRPQVVNHPLPHPGPLQCFQYGARTVCQYRP